MEHIVEEKINLKKLNLIFGVNVFKLTDKLFEGDKGNKLRGKRGR